MPNNWSERLETGEIVKNDQTVTMRVFHARRKVRGKMSSQCGGGCGAYLTDEEKETHQCPGPPASLPRRTRISRWKPKVRAKKKKQRPQKVKVRQFVKVDGQAIEELWKAKARP